MNIRVKNFMNNEMRKFFKQSQLKITFLVLTNQVVVKKFSYVHPICYRLKHLLSNNIILKCVIVMSMNFFRLSDVFTQRLNSISFEIDKYRQDQPINIQNNSCQNRLCMVFYLAGNISRIEIKNYYNNFLKCNPGISSWNWISELWIRIIL